MEAQHIGGSKIFECMSCGSRLVDEDELKCLTCDHDKMKIIDKELDALYWGIKYSNGYTSKQLEKAHERFDKRFNELKSV